MAVQISYEDMLLLYRMLYNLQQEVIMLSAMVAELRCVVQAQTSSPTRMGTGDTVEGL